MAWFPHSVAKYLFAISTTRPDLVAVDSKGSLVVYRRGTDGRPIGSALVWVDPADIELHELRGGQGAALRWLDRQITKALSGVGLREQFGSFDDLGNPVDEQHVSIPPLEHPMYVGKIRSIE
jgi:hypothetical protein